MGKHDLSERANRFWLRVTEGMQLSQLWDAVSNRRQVRLPPILQRGRFHARGRCAPGRHFFSVAQPILLGDYLEAHPARRVLLLIAFVLVFLPAASGPFQTKSETVKVFALDFHFYGGLLMFASLHSGGRRSSRNEARSPDRKRDPTWLLPANPPQIPGLEIAFTTRPANTVAGDYYDVFARPNEGQETDTSYRNCRRRRQKHPRRYADGDLSGEPEDPQQHPQLVDRSW